jgi:hypothetical protein
VGTDRRIKKVVTRDGEETCRISRGCHREAGWWEDNASLNTDDTRAAGGKENHRGEAEWVGKDIKEDGEVNKSSPSSQ